MYTDDAGVRIDHQRRAVERVADAFDDDEGADFVGCILEPAHLGAIDRDSAVEGPPELGTALL